MGLVYDLKDCLFQLLGFGLGSLDLAFAWCFLGQDQSQQDGHVAKALDLAMIFDYWGRGTWVW